MRVPQKRGERGSLRLVQQLVSEHAELLDVRLRELGAISRTNTVNWVSPLADDDSAEYRDSKFLERIGRPDLGEALQAFWPKRGPQWDALGVAGEAVILVEAKAHVGELASSCAAGAKASLQKIRQSLTKVKAALGATPEADWLTGYYQLANRLAHLWLLRSHGVNAHLVLLQFTGETGMPTPATRQAYELALREAMVHLGLDGRVPVGVHHVYLDVAEIA